jgi:hypothetical protein
MPRPGRSARIQAAARIARIKTASLFLALLICAGLISSKAAFAGMLPAAPGNDKDKMPAVRWDEQNPGCTFSRGDDGKFRYGLWSGDVGITLTVDSQELAKVHRRHEPFFSVILDIRYRGTGSVDFDGKNMSLEFVKHFQVRQPAFDPEDFAQKVQADADTLDHDTAREIEKHPEKKEEKEVYARSFQKDASELIEFVSKNSLKPAHLGPTNGEIGGWVLFSVQSKWIGKWKKQEDFVLRVPLDGKMFEFPFQLPPKPSDIVLRKRE